jgi:hypothetical protein
MHMTADVVVWGSTNRCYNSWSIVVYGLLLNRKRVIQTFDWKEGYRWYYYLDILFSTLILILISLKKIIFLR